MSNRKKFSLILVLFLLPGFVLVACQLEKNPPVRATLVPISLEPYSTATPTAAPKDDTVTLYINWETDPLSLDPALATDEPAINVIRNIFVGLTQFDHNTGAVLPYLATSWEAGTDAEGNQTWTFHLRDDIPWVNYNPSTGETNQVTNADGDPAFVTAQDVEYGVKRTLDPNTGSPNASILYIIQNGEKVNKGEEGFTLDDIGVAALDDATIQFTLTDPAGYFPAIAGMWVAYPVPAATINQWGEKWTEANLIVTNGPYLLEEWIHGRELNLVKNPFWVNFEDVQIERVQGVMINDAGFKLYENNEVDLVNLPPRIFQCGIAGCPKSLIRELHITPVPCTFYYGFNNQKAPFDDVRVRRAFSAAIDRKVLVDNVTQGSEIPATSFAPPGIFGAPKSGSAGRGFDLDLAFASLQEYLDEKGMTLDDFNAMDIVLMHNTSEGQANIAAAIQQMWSDILGVEVNVVEEGTLYMEIISKNTSIKNAPHIWQMGRCAAYPDENNWVHEVFNSEVGENRLRRNCADLNCAYIAGPSKFDQLTTQAALETDPAKRAALYAEAEYILSEVEVAYAPIYHYTKVVFTKPWLTQNYPLIGGYDIFNWTINWASRP